MSRARDGARRTSTSSPSAPGTTRRDSWSSLHSRVHDALATIPADAPRDDRGDLQRPLAARSASSTSATRTPSSCARVPNSRPRSPACARLTSRGSRLGARRTRGSVRTSSTSLREKRADGVTDVVSCPIGFVSDHLEVLFDIDIEAQSVAREIGRQPRAHGVAQRRPRLHRPSSRTSSCAARPPR